MTKTNRKAARAARKLARFTRDTWNPARHAELAGDPAPMRAASDARLAMILPHCARGSEMDHNRLRKLLRRTEYAG
jgi:hypothetical protein